MANIAKYKIESINDPKTFLKMQLQVLLKTLEKLEN